MKKTCESWLSWAAEMAQYKKVKAGAWEQPVRRGYRLVCCDCGLVHKVDFRIHGGRVQMRAWRDEKSTKVWRKQNRITMKSGG